MLTAIEYLEQQTKSYNMDFFAEGRGRCEVYVTETTSGADLIQLVTLLEERGYKLSFHKDNSIWILAPHHGEHPKDINPWSCGAETTLLGCRVIRQVEGGRARA